MTYPQIRRTGRSVACVVIACAVAGILSARVIAADNAKPWWKEQKIRFMWGCWAPTNHEVPRYVIRNAALSGATVFAELWSYLPADARIAKEFGMQYFAGTQARHPLWYKEGRAWVKQNGEGEGMNEALGDYWIKCPLDDYVYERWLVTPHLEGAREGIVDGIHVDWEAPGYTCDPCYCDDCFSKFLELKGIKMALPAKAERFGLLEDRSLVQAYEDNFHQRRVEMFTRIRLKLQAVNPDLLFASYGTEVTDFTRAMNAPETPFVFLDARHYYNDDRQPWWESPSYRLRKEGYLYIAGGWVNALFGSQPSQVSAAQWIYETSINEDGCWLWFEHELTDDVLAAYSAADRRIRTVLNNVGDYLFEGERDPNFITASEWTGRPDLARALVHETYRLGDAHLAHLNNVNTDWPLRARIRFPRLADDKRWTVRDRMSEDYYTRDGKTAVWTTADLLAGVVVSMEPRSDLFLLVSPARDSVDVDPLHLMHSRDFDTLPAYADASAKAGAVKGNAFSLPKDGWHLKMDENDVGVEKKWFLPDAPLDGWEPIEIETFWGGKGGEGVGWYRGDVTFPEPPEGKPVYLHFGAVDEELMLWIDGDYVGEHNIGPEGWDKSFSLDVTGKLTAGEHHIAMRVVNSAHAGGVWKPITIVSDPGADTVPGAALSQLARLVYTATESIAMEQLAFEGGCGVDALIDNTIRTVDRDGANQLRLRQLWGYLWSPQYSPDGKRIAFVHDAGGRGQIFLMNEDGADPLNVSNNDFCDRSPVWSPDGGTIAFISDRTGDWEIFVMNADGSDQRRLAGNPGLDRAPAWSPDGTRIAWESHTSGVPDIWICNADGRNPRPLTAGDHYMMDPVWSPDGSKIAAVGVENMGTVVVVLDSDDSSMIEVIPWIAGPGNLTWSSDGTMLAGTLRAAPQESERSGIFVVKADGTEPYRWLVDVTPNGPRLGGALRKGLMTWYAHGSAEPRRVVKTFCSLTWSPDGKTLAFSSDMDPSGAFYVYTISPEGGKPKRLDGTVSAWPNEIMWQPR